MQPWRQELRELIRSVETVLSLEAFGAPLSAEERGVILLLCRRPGKEVFDARDKATGRP